MNQSHYFLFIVANVANYTSILIVTLLKRMSKLEDNESKTNTFLTLRLSLFLCLDYDDHLKAFRSVPDGLRASFETRISRSPESGVV